VSVPDVLLQPHSASMEMTFYNSGQFPAETRGDAPRSVVADPEILTLGAQGPATG
jgi:glucose/arabinose dehydrogenase